MRQAKYRYYSLMTLPVESCSWSDRGPSCLLHNIEFLYGLPPDRFVVTYFRADFRAGWEFRRGQYLFYAEN